MAELTLAEKTRRRQQVLDLLHTIGEQWIKCAENGQDWVCDFTGGDRELEPVMGNDGKLYARGEMDGSLGFYLTIRGPDGELPPLPTHMPGREDDQRAGLCGAHFAGVPHTA